MAGILFWGVALYFSDTVCRFSFFQTTLICWLFHIIILVLVINLWAKALRDQSWNQKYVSMMITRQSQPNTQPTSVHPTHHDENGHTNIHPQQSEATLPRTQAVRYMPLGQTPEGKSNPSTVTTTSTTTSSHHNPLISQPRLSARIIRNHDDDDDEDDLKSQTGVAAVGHLHHGAHTTSNIDLFSMTRQENGGQAATLSPILAAVQSTPSLVSTAQTPTFANQSLIRLHAQTSMSSIPQMVRRRSDPRIPC